MMMKRAAASAALLMSLSAPVQAGPISYFTSGADVDIPGVANFATTGAMMDGLAVTACFLLQGVESCDPTLFWADTGTTSGGVSGNSWSLSVGGDTYTANAWSFAFANQDRGQIVSLLLDGTPALTIFDRTEPAGGTVGSENGRDFNTAAGGPINVTYGGPTGVAGAVPVGDLFHSVFIQFLDAQGPRVSFTFSQDTDNDSRLQVPEPGSLALLAIAMLGLGVARRRR